jgi:hypothetical protein
MATVAYCYIENGQTLLGVDNSGDGEKVKEVRLVIDKDMLELMEGGIEEARIDFDERQAAPTLPSSSGSKSKRKAS